MDQHGHRVRDGSGVPYCPSSPFPCTLPLRLLPPPIFHGAVPPLTAFSVSPACLPASLHSFFLSLSVATTQLVEYCRWAQRDVQWLSTRLSMQDTTRSSSGSSRGLVGHSFSVFMDTYLRTPLCQILQEWQVESVFLRLLSQELSHRSRVFPKFTSIASVPSTTLAAQEEGGMRSTSTFPLGSTLDTSPTIQTHESSLTTTTPTPTTTPSTSLDRKKMEPTEAKDEPHPPVEDVTEKRTVKENKTEKEDFHESEAEQEEEAKDEEEEEEEAEEEEEETVNNDTPPPTVVSITIPTTPSPPTGSEKATSTTTTTTTTVTRTATLAPPPLEKKSAKSKSGKKEEPTRVKSPKQKGGGGGSGGGKPSRRGEKTGGRKGSRRRQGAPVHGIAGKSGGGGGTAPVHLHRRSRGERGGGGSSVVRRGTLRERVRLWVQERSLQVVVHVADVVHFILANQLLCLEVCIGIALCSWLLDMGGWMIFSFPTFF